jgi:hypothetical protein
MRITDHMATTSGTLAAETAAQLAAGQSCTFLLVMNNGVNPMVVRFGSTPTSDTDGIALDGASAAGGQGGSLMLTENQISTDDIYGMSALGTTYTVLQGVDHP